MSDAAAVIAVILFLFFLAGVAAGIVVVIAASARRAVKMYRPIDDEPPYPFEAELDDDGPDRPPRWPTRGGY
jgi:hypothetical protein